MTELSEVPYLSAKQVSLFKKNNINTVIDLLYSFPSRFEDYTIVAFDDVLDLTKVVTIAGIVQSKATVMNLKSSLTMMNFFADVDGNVIKVTIFNRQFLKTKIHYGKYVRLTGKFDANKKRFVLMNGCSRWEGGGGRIVAGGGGPPSLERNQRCKI